MGAAQITIQFALDRNIDAAAQDVQAAITAAQRAVAAGHAHPAHHAESQSRGFPDTVPGLVSPTLPLSAVDEYAQNFLAQRISMVSGVSQVQVYGSQKYAVRVQVDPNVLASRRIGIDEVAERHRAGEREFAHGHPGRATPDLYRRSQRPALRRRGLPAADRHLPQRLSRAAGELGRVIDSVENDKIASWRTNTRAIVLAIQRQPGTNTVETVDAIRALLPTFRDQLPASVALNTLYDRSQTIRASVTDVKFTLLLTMSLVILVIFLFLRNVSATVIPSLALPMSVVGTFAVMYLMGFSLDNLSLMALTLSVGSWWTTPS